MLTQIPIYLSLAAILVGIGKLLQDASHTKQSAEKSEKRLDGVHEKLDGLGQRVARIEGIHDANGCGEKAA